MKVAILSPYRSSNAPTMTDHSSALNRYTEHLARAVATCDVEVVVLAVDDGEGDRVWQDGSVRIRHVCRRGSAAFAFRVLAAIREEAPSIVHVQHELFAYGGLREALSLTILLNVLAARRVRVVTTIHGVIPLDKIDREFIRLNGWHAPRWLVCQVWHTMLRLVAIPSTIVVLHAVSLERLLRKQYGISIRTAVIPHGVDASLTSPVARKRAPEQERAKILFFGFLSSYKGIDFLADEIAFIRKAKPRASIIIAGEVPARLRKSSRRLNNAVERLKRSENVEFRGFVAEDAVAELFHECDIVILPYRVVMAASGPLCLALEYRRPCLVSSEFLDLRSTALSFDLVPGGLSRAIVSTIDDPGRLEAILTQQELLLEAADWPVVARSFLRVYARAENTQ